MSLNQHQSTRADSCDWITPQRFLDALGPFDLDPCASPTQPWPTATTMLTSGGLQASWGGSFVWLNPPYSDVDRWMSKLAAHGHGLAFIPARTETRWFHRSVWQRAAAVFFLHQRSKFHRSDGSLPPSSCGYPCVFVAYGRIAETRLVDRRDQLGGGILARQWEVAA